jgi:hypothetical protein
MGRMREIAAQSSQPYIEISIMADEPYGPYVAQPKTFGERMAAALKASAEFTRNFIEGFTIFIVSSFVPLLVFAAVVVAVVFIIRKVRWIKK